MDTEEKMIMSEVLDEFQNWLETNWPVDMSPSESRKALDTLDELGMKSFDEILEEYSNLNLDPEDFDFDTTDSEFEEKYSEMINEHMSYIEEYCGGDSYDDDEW